jgi:hypothetical protein
MKATYYSEMSVYNKPTRGHIPEDGILQVKATLKNEAAKKATMMRMMKMIIIIIMTN